MCALHMETPSWWPETIGNDVCSHENQNTDGDHAWSNLQLLAGWRYSENVIAEIDSEINAENGKPEDLLFQIPTCVQNLKNV